MGLATRHFRDELACVDGGFVRASFSVSTQISSGGIIDMAKYRKLIFQLYADGIQYGDKKLSLYSCSTSASSISSASSNWAVVDSVNAIVTMASSLASLSTARYMAELETRAEKAPRYIRPVVTCTSGVSSSSVDNAFMVIFGGLTQYGPASGVDTITVVSEVDYL